MIRTLLLTSLAAHGLLPFSQCIPNQLYADSVFRVWPDTTANFADGTVRAPHSDTSQNLLPSDASLISPLMVGFTIASVVMVQLSGLPPGIAVGCNSQTGAPCTYLATQVGCGLLEGTPTQMGAFDMEIEVVAYLQIFGSTQA